MRGGRQKLKTQKSLYNLGLLIYPLEVLAFAKLHVSIVCVLTIEILNIPNSLSSFFDYDFINIIFILMRGSYAELAILFISIVC